MDSDPWADTPATPRTGTPRVSIEQSPAILVQTTETEAGSESESPKATPNSTDLTAEDEPRDASPSSPSSPSADELASSIPIENLHVDSPREMNDSPQVNQEGQEDTGDPEENGGFDDDDFDDFDAPEAGPSRTSEEVGDFAGAGDGDDGFGDFGDFEEGDFDAPPPPEEVAVAPVAAQSWVSQGLDQIDAPYQRD